MKTRYNKSKIMRNAWFLRKIQPTMAFSVCLRKAWRNEKLAMLEDAQAKTTTYNPELLTIPADYYGERGRYYGD